MHHPSTVRILRMAGHEVYDFRDPPAGNTAFQWEEIDPKWQSWSPEQFKAALAHPLAVRGFESDFSGMKWAEACVLTLPSGRSSHVEAGIMKGWGRPVVVIRGEDAGEPELTYKAFDEVCYGPGEAALILRQLEER